MSSLHPILNAETNQSGTHRCVGEDIQVATEDVSGRQHIHLRKLQNSRVRGTGSEGCGRRLTPYTVVGRGGSGVGAKLISGVLKRPMPGVEARLLLNPGRVWLIIATEECWSQANI